MNRVCFIMAVLLSACSAGALDSTSSQPNGKPGVVRVLALDVEGSFPSWASDGSVIAVGAAKAGVLIVPLGPKPVQVVTGDPYHNGPVWGPSGSRMAFVDESEETKRLYVVENLRHPRLDLLPLGEGVYFPQQPWSPEGDSLLYWTAAGEVRAVDIASRKTRNIASGSAPCIRGEISYLRWNQTGSITATGARSGAMILRSGDSTWTCLDEREARHVIEGNDGAVWWISDNEALQVDRSGDKTTIPLAGHISSFDVNPRTGSAVASVSRTGLFLVSRDGGKVSRLTSLNHQPVERGVGSEMYPNDGAPVWSPDGTMVAFVRFEGLSEANLCVVTTGE